LDIRPLTERLAYDRLNTSLGEAPAVRCPYPQLTSYLAFGVRGD
jgi:hypothetical protein